MIIFLVTFRLPKRWGVEEAAKVFRSTASKYVGKPGLIRKHYYVIEAGDRAGGIYLWQSRADAEACYTPGWKAIVADKYGAQPEILYLQVPVTVDNLKHLVEAE